jgi:hypothetical protein
MYIISKIRAYFQKKREKRRIKEEEERKQKEEERKRREERLSNELAKKGIHGDAAKAFKAHGIELDSPKFSVAIYV